MADYTPVHDFSAKDVLASGNSDKIAKGEHIDDETAAIQTAIATKYDSTDLASQAQAEAEASNVTLVTPLRLANWSDKNAGMVGDIQALADPNADVLLGWDDSAGAAIGFTLDASLETTTTALGIAAAAAGDGITLTTGVLSLTDAAASTTNPVDISTGAVSLDVEALTTIEGNALAATDTFYVEDGGVSKGIEVQAFGLRSQTAQGTQTLAADDMNSIMEFTATSTLTLPLNATTALPIGVPVVLNMKHATQELTITADTSVTLVSVYHPGGTAAASDILNAGGSAILYKTAADVWVLSGDIKDS
jgi:hypothetical protein